MAKNTLVVTVTLALLAGGGASAQKGIVMGQLNGRTMLAPAVLRIEKALAPKLSNGQHLTTAEFDQLMASVHRPEVYEVFKKVSGDTVLMPFSEDPRGERIGIRGHVIRDKNGTSMVIFSSGVELNGCGRLLALYTSKTG